MKTISILIFVCAAMFAHGQQSTTDMDDFDTRPFDSAGLSMLDTLIEDRNFVFSSELHYHKYSLQVQREFMNYLAKHGSLDILGLEQDYAFGFEINHYFQTGDSSRLRKLFNYHPEMTVSLETTDFFKHYLDLKAWRDSMKIAFEVVGLDIVGFGSSTGFKGSIFSVLEIIRASKQGNLEDVILMGESLLTMKKVKYKDLENWLDFLESEQSKLGLDTQDIVHGQAMTNIIFNMKQTIKVENEKGFTREEQISVNFKRYCNPDDHVYAQYGFAHVFRKSDSRYPKFGGDTFIDLLNSDVNYKDKSIIVQFMPWAGTKMFFPLLRAEEINSIRPIIESRSFPILVDFRKVEAVKDCFDFFIIVKD